MTDAHPYVLLNYLGKQRDVMTLAHELGHGVHQRLAAPQGELLASTPLTLAETASVFGEMLTFQKLLAAAPDATARKVLLAGKVEDMINTVVRQIAFYDFECRLHAQRREGELTPDDINAIWIAVQGESLGPAFSFMDGYETFWTYIPHFIHSPFYVYAYAFGDGLVNALYAVYQEGDPAFAEQVLRDAGGRGRQAPQGAPGALRPRRHRPGVLGQGPRGHRRHDRRAGGDGGLRPRVRRTLARFHREKGAKLLILLKQECFEVNRARTHPRPSRTH